MLLTFILIVISIPSPLTLSFRALKLSFAANPSHRSFSFFFRTDSPDCLLLLKHIRFFLLFSISVLLFLVVVGPMR